ncbi:MAG: vWA domain-containing protein [Planctomycetota bacterium]
MHQLLLLVLAISLLCHITLIMVLAYVRRGLPAAGAAEPVAFEIAVVQEEELTELEAIEFDDLLPDTLLEIDNEATDQPAVELDAEMPAADLQVVAAGSVPSLGGGGGDGGGQPGLGGGAAGTSFFGVASTGTRFAYIVDRSGSMGNDAKLETALAELGRSIQSLPDYAYFYVVLFSSKSVLPPMQRGWMRAQRANVSRLSRWLDSEVDAGGGTLPREAFIQVFALDVRPDVIFFLTDGRVQDFSAAEAAAMNRRGKRVVINTIAFGDPSSQDMLKEMARQSGGVYRYVPSQRAP